MSWHSLKIDGVAEIERSVGVFVVGPKRDDLPMRFRIKVLERQDGTFLAHPEIAIKDKEGQPDWVSGAGRTMEQALSSAFEMLLGSIAGKEPLTDASIWWDPRF